LEIFATKIVQIKRLTKMPDIDQLYWEHRYKNSQTGWDIGYASPALTNYINQLESKNLRILIPGCGNAYEAEFLLENQFENITLIDIARPLVEQIEQKFAHSIAQNKLKVLHTDFFEHNGEYDLILEQTFFCAIPPQKRLGYAKKMHELLTPSGKLSGLLFDMPMLGEEPPFGGNRDEYMELFAPYFQIQTLEPCTNSIKPRAGRELFFVLRKT